MVADLDHMTNGIAMLEERSISWHSNVIPLRICTGCSSGTADGGAMVGAARGSLVLLEAVGGGGHLSAARRMRTMRQPGPLVAFDMDHGGALCRNRRTGAPLSEGRSN
jgi:hypothetical protein